MKVHLFLNHTPCQPPIINENDYIIAVDGGSNHCLNYGYSPHLAIGDFDSISAENLKVIDKESQLIRFNKEKDQSDLQLALEHLPKSATEIIAYGVFGGRPDHELCNLQVLAHHCALPVTAPSIPQSMIIMRDNMTISVKGKQLSTVSCLSLSQEVSGLTLIGFKYPLSDSALSFGSSLGLSNELDYMPQNNHATIRIKKGDLAVFFDPQVVISITNDCSQ